MKPFLYLNKLLKFSKINNIKNILLQKAYVPYDMDTKSHLISFEVVGEEIFSFINEHYLKKNKSIIELQNSNYLIQTNAGFMSIRELIKTEDKLSNKEFISFIYGSRNYKILYKEKELINRHKKTYELINTIRELNDEPILLIETDKYFIHKSTCNLINLFNPVIEPETFIRLIKNIDFKFLILPDLNNQDLIYEILDKFYNKKVFISHDIDISFANYDENLILLSNTKKEPINKIKFDESVFNKTINRLTL